MTHSDSICSVQVVAAVIYSADRSSVLITQRRQDQEHAGLWEFPGGKLEEGESALHALKRELQEELNINVVNADFMKRFPWHYPDKTVELEVWQVAEFSGLPDSCEGQQLRWQPVHELDKVSLLEADAGIATALQLPPVYAITPEWPEDEDGLLQQVAHLFNSEKCMLQIRLKPPVYLRQTFYSLTRRIIELASSYAQPVLINADVALANDTGAGLHLTSTQLTELTCRPVSRQQLLGASIHSLTELERALYLDVDFVVLSPVCETLSHPGVEPLGWERFADILNQCPLPVYALGGVGVKDLTTALARGAQGVAGIRTFFPAC